jgi:nitroreductase
MKNILDALHWRYATKAYDSSQKISSEQLEQLLEVVRLSPSSFGLQPYKIIHVTNPDLREKLKAASWGQTQITDASELLVFAVSTNLNDSHVDTFIERTAAVRNMPIEQLAEYAGMIKGSINSRNESEKTHWATKQAYIALGLLLETAALEHIDATPMEGFDTAQYNEILGLKDMNLTAAVVATLGYRSKDDTYANLAKVRVPMEELVIKM